MAKIAAGYLFSGIAVTDYARAAGWYETLFGRMPDVIVRDEIECMWEIREGAWIYIVLDSERAGKSLVTVLVEDLERTLLELSGRGVRDWKTEIVPDVYRKAIITDADGNTLTFAATLQQTE
jgi:hypothetical protein